ncbi:hypothetical protein GCM10011506_05410 [Marivirga lumbricoides]|uniref:PA14 domain-containing protein n=1 Tax=Marivirga lumbricoides TaxID=1046115 RepID=A0ABQ1LFB3_9BACT|nr:hypothetical protein GCM10011506_05410 [Marivirga lumbricoides]
MTKKTFKIVFFLIGLSVVAFSTKAQNFCFHTEQTAILLPDSVIVLPSSISVQADNNDSVPFQYDKTSHLLNIKAATPQSTYKVCFNYVLKKSTVVKAPLSISLYDSTVLFKEKLQKNNHTKSTQEVLGLSALNIEGAFLRSVSAGQRQSVFMHSVMDLSISGKISDDLMLQARLTDQQMPFEPEGNTQRLQDFDRVNVQLKHKNWSLQGGDIIIQSAPQAHFLRYNRQVQGVGISTPKLSFDSAISNTELVSSFSRSKAGMQLLQPIEGVLGPYRIKGPQNEPFIFLLAGSERVYLDGQLLQRGIENDYVIDYNAAEITFNASIYINKFSRIQIEFEYSDQQYSRNVTAFNHQQSFDRLSIRASVFQEADQPNRALYDLSFDDMQAISNLDANANVGRIPAVDSIGYQEGKILYGKKKVIEEGNEYDVYYYSSHRDSALYQVNFSLVGDNKGNYIIASSEQNAVVYEWVAPINDIPQGNYEPLKQVALPRKQRVLALGADYKLKNNDLISFDFASSEKTNNRFNPQASKNVGKAFSLAYKSNPRKLFSGKDFLYQYQLSYEYLDSAFLPVQIFRSVDFNRNWGVEQTGNYIAGREHLVGFGGKISNKSQHLTYQSYWREKENFGQGHQQNFQYQYMGNWKLNSDLFFMQSSGELNDTQWLKALMDLSYNRWKINPGYRFQSEKHSAFQQDSIISSFMNFNTHQIYLQKQDSSHWNFKISHDFRSNYQVFDHEFQLLEKSQTTQVTSGLNYGYNNGFTVTLLRRNIQAAHESSDAQDLYQGAVQWSAELWNGNIVQSLYYQTGTGRVLERNYFFREVARRMGTHSWSDLNGNGEQELNEFFEDQTEYGDRNFIKILTMGDDYQTAYVNTARYQLNLRTPNSWKKSSGLLRYAGRFSSQFQANLETKNLYDSWEKRMSPFMSNTGTKDVLSGKQFLKWNIFYNRGGKASLDFGITDSERKQLLMSGFEGNQIKAYQVSGSWNALSAWDIMATYRSGYNKSYSEVVAERDFSYSSQLINPQLHWQGSKNWRTILSYENHSKDSPDEVKGGNVTVDQLSMSNKFIQSSGGIFESKIGLVQVKSNLADNYSPLAYEMFEGLRAGRNYIWNVSLRQKIVGDLHMVLQYGGRKSTETSVIHNGSVQLSALF